MVDSPGLPCFSPYVGDQHEGLQFSLFSMFVSQFTTLEIACGTLRAFLQAVWLLGVS